MYYHTLGLRFLGMATICIQQERKKYVDAPEVELSADVVLKRQFDDAASYARARRKECKIWLWTDISSFIH